MEAAFSDLNEKAFSDRIEAEGAFPEKIEAAFSALTEGAFWKTNDADGALDAVFLDLLDKLEKEEV
ncbi:hypothetical protein BpHYR1_053026 [Brachionus plicatilis]|uniref:Uncharacterized protein n=1 Tax=Brachionus plicatilis TaxID=10195 RepID=A0A3M7PBN2_BRAPC|nr:hypothetical protein BpHYR1_053026 [Brachionus plicatilis]